MNIFSKIAGRESNQIFRLGAPSGNPDLRIAEFSGRTGGRGFRQRKKVPFVVMDGMTRGEIKRESRRKFREGFKGEERPRKHMHSSKRKALELEDFKRSRGAAA